LRIGARDEPRSRPARSRPPTSSGPFLASGPSRLTRNDTRIRSNQHGTDQPKQTSDAGKILDRITGNEPKLRETIEEQRLNVRVAEMIYEARDAAGLTQAALAKLVGTTQSVISRLEDADYEGRSLTMLQRIADALHQRLDVRLVPGAPRSGPSPGSITIVGKSRSSPVSIIGPRINCPNAALPRGSRRHKPSRAPTTTGSLLGGGGTSVRDSASVGIV
jgi:transcriptional regulator with XRE-family HTH domain